MSSAESKLSFLYLEVLEAGFRSPHDILQYAFLTQSDTNSRVLIQCEISSVQQMLVFCCSILKCCKNKAFVRNPLGCRIGTHTQSLDTTMNVQDGEIGTLTQHHKSMEKGEEKQ